MPEDEANLYARLKRVFHEPNRLAIMSALAAAADGLTFLQLRQACNLTDGNLSRHLKALEDAKLVHLRKRFVGVKPQTTITMTAPGREDFVEYLNALASVLLKASEALEQPGRAKTPAADVAGAAAAQA